MKNSQTQIYGNIFLVFITVSFLSQQKNPICYWPAAIDYDLTQNNDELNKEKRHFYKIVNYIPKKIDENIETYVLIQTGESMDMLFNNFTWSYDMGILFDLWDKNYKFKFIQVLWDMPFQYYFNQELANKNYNRMIQMNPSRSSYFRT
jgi:hypothetical protein